MMRYFAENPDGVDLFFVEFIRTPAGWHSVESSLPDIIFRFEDVKVQVRNVLKYDFSSIEYYNSVKLLLSSIMKRKAFSIYYFQPVELKQNGKYNSEQGNVLNEIVANQDVEYFLPITIKSNPFIFRYVYRNIDLFNYESLIVCSIEEYNHYISPENKITYHTKENCMINCLVLNDADRIYLKYFNGMPEEFYFYRQSEWDKISC